MLRWVLLLVALLAAASGVLWMRGTFDPPARPEVRQAAVSRGPILQTVIATGALQGTRTVDVGSQLSGTVKKMFVDYNSIVTKGEVIAEMDSQPIQDQVASAQAMVDRTDIELSNQKTNLAADEVTLAREEELFSHALIPPQEREQAELQVKIDQASIKQATAAETVARDNLKQAEVNLSYCTIHSPVDGVVVARNADEGQAVTASMSVPSLYVIATDVRKLDLVALVDESDIGKLHTGQPVTFTVAAYPSRDFAGSLDRVRLSASNVNNVVTYQAVVSVDNQDLRLRPSMTATLKIKVAETGDAIRVPNSAVRFKPTPQMFAAYGQAVPPAIANPAPSSSSNPTAKSSAAIVAAASDPKPVRPAVKDPKMIDQEFPIMPRPSSAGQVWVMEHDHLISVPIQLGITDGTWTELTGGALEPGEELVIGISLPAKKK